MCNCNKQRTYKGVTSVNLPPPANPTEAAQSSAKNSAENANSN